LRLIMDARVKPAHDPQCVAPRLKRSLPGSTRQSMRHRRWSAG